VANIYIGADGVPIEQDSDNVFRVTQSKIDDSKQFIEIVEQDNDGETG
jgi:hypothetical protein